MFSLLGHSTVESALTEQLLLVTRAVPASILNNLALIMRPSGKRLKHRLSKPGSSWSDTQDFAGSIHREA
jgi:hypothetical protein